MKQTEKNVDKDAAVSIALHESTCQTTTKGDDKNTNKNESGGYENSAEPTRYGDWEIAGRCIDF